MGIAKTVLRNVAANWFGFSVNMAVMFFLTPFVIQHLGIEAYGLWVILQSLIGYYGLVDMGFRAGMVQTITRHIANGDHDAVISHISTAIPVLLVLAGAVVTLATLLGTVLPIAIEIPEHLSAIILPFVILKSVAFALQLVGAPLSAILIGIQRFDVSNACLAVERVIYGLAIYVALKCGGGLLSMAMVSVCIRIVELAVRHQLVRSLFPAILNVKWQRNRGELKEMWKFGIWNLMIHLGRQLIFCSDAVVIAVLFNPAAVVPFAIAGSLIDYCNKLVTQAVRVLFPTMAHLRSAKNLNVQRELYSTATRLIAGVSLTLIICGIFMIKPFLSLWLASTDAREIVLANSPALFVILGAASFFVGLHRVGTQLMLACERNKRIAFFYFIEGASNIILSLILGYHFGVWGVAVGTLIPAALVAVAGHLPAHAHILRISVGALLTSVLTRPLLYGSVLSLLMTLADQYVPTAKSWAGLILQCLCYGSLAAALCLFMLLARDQRRRLFAILQKPISRLALSRP